MDDATGPHAPVEPVTPMTPRPLRLPVLRQGLSDVALLHWEVPVGSVARLLPPGTRPDTIDGRTFVGLVPLRMLDPRLGVGPAVPGVRTVLQTNVRLYSVDGRGRRGVVFRSLDADSLAVVAAARAALGLPYHWSSMSVGREDAGGAQVLRYESRRRGSGVRSRVVVRVGEVIGRPTPLERWLTCRWALHAGRFGHTAYLSNAHEEWPLHRAEALEVDDGLVAAAGLPGVTARPPDSVLWSPGVDFVFGPTR